MPMAPKAFRAAAKATRGRHSQSYQAWYQKPEWKALRNIVLHRDHFVCQACLRAGITKALMKHTTHDDPANQAHVDHIKAHQGVWERFIDIENLETLCGTCHRRKTRQEQNDGIV